MDLNFLGNINSIYALIGVVLMLSFQVWSKNREDKRYREERFDEEKKQRMLDIERANAKQEMDKQMHAENMEATNKVIETQIEQTKAIIESLNRNNEITDLHTENIIDLAETIDKRHRVKKAVSYKEKYKNAESKHKKKLC